MTLHDIAETEKNCKLSLRPSTVPFLYTPVNTPELSLSILLALMFRLRSDSRPLKAPTLILERRLLERSRSLSEVWLANWSLPRLLRELLNSKIVDPGVRSSCSVPGEVDAGQLLIVLEAVLQLHYLVVGDVEELNMRIEKVGDVTEFSSWQ